MTAANSSTTKRYFLDLILDQVLVLGLILVLDLILVLVHDPAAVELGEGQRTRVVMGDGRMQTEIDLASDAARQALTGFSRQRLERIVRWQQELNLSVLPLSAGEETLPQIRRLLGRLAPRRRVR